MLKILLFSVHPLSFCSAVPLLEERDVGRGLIGRMFYDPKCIYRQKNTISPSYLMPPMPANSAAPNIAIKTK